jgi:phosphatidylserine/phosphatidylglycerophosphate/cardiolipin synthase-like enzyme
MLTRPATRRLLGLNRYLCVFLALSISACGRSPSVPEPPPAATPRVQAASDRDWFRVYFTDPQSPTAKSYRGGPDQALATAISKAQASVDMAFYDLNLASVTEALMAAYKSGVEVRLVTESDNLDEPQVQDLEAAGVPLRDDQQEGLMHDSFAVIDHQEVWTGSMDFTTGDGYLNDNNLIRIRSSNLAQDYTAEFEQMYVKNRFGPEKIDPPPYPELHIEDAQLEVYFSPTDHTTTHLEALIRSARQSIYFLAFTFTSDALADAIIQQAGAGVKVAGVMEETQVGSKDSGTFGRFQKAKLNIRLDGNLRNMHHKVLIIDGQVVVTGSFNFSPNAEQENDENTLVVHSSRVAEQYLAEFDRIYAEAKE